MRNDTLYTPEEIAQKLKLSKYTIYEMIKKGEIPAHRIGRSLRISESQFEAYLIDSKQTENAFDAFVEVNSEGEQIATIDKTDVKIVVSTDLVGEVRLMIKAEDIILSRNFLECSARNNLEGIITGMEETALGYKVIVNVGIPLTVGVTKSAVKNLDLKLEDPIFAVFKAMAVIVV